MSKTKKDKPERLQEREKRRERHPKPYRRSHRNRDISGEDNWGEDSDSDDSMDLRGSVVVPVPGVFFEELVRFNLMI